MAQPILKCMGHWKKGTQKSAIGALSPMDFSDSSRDFIESADKGTKVKVSVHIGKRRKFLKGRIGLDLMGGCGDPRCCGPGVRAVLFS